MIFHLERSLKTGRRTREQSCDSHMHTAEIMSGTTSDFALGQCQWGHGGSNSSPIFSFPFVSTSPKDQSNGRNVNEQST